MESMIPYYGDEPQDGRYYGLPNVPKSSGSLFTDQEARMNGPYYPTQQHYTERPRMSFAPNPSLGQGRAAADHNMLSYGASRATMEPPVFRPHSASRTNIASNRAREAVNDLQGQVSKLRQSVDEVTKEVSSLRYLIGDLKKEFVLLVSFRSD